jgi:hypothetical protein
VVDCKDRAWIHEASTNKLIGFDQELNTKVSFEGLGSFDSKNLGTTEVLVCNLARTKIYWHKGQGHLSQIDPVEGTEVAMGDSISDTQSLISMKVSKNDAYLIALEGNFQTLQLYDLKK